MYGEQHDLYHEFPEYADKIHQLKITNAHFAALFERYYKIDKEIHRIEQQIETPSDEYTEDLKKQRVHLKDELFAMLKSS